MKTKLLSLFTDSMVAPKYEIRGKVKACPCCGYEFIRAGMESGSSVYIRCANESCRLGIVVPIPFEKVFDLRKGKREALALAIERWNKRHERANQGG